MINNALSVIEVESNAFKEYLSTLTAKELEELRIQFSNLAKLTSSKNSIIYHFYRKTFSN